MYCNTTGDCDPSPVVQWYKMPNSDVSIHNDTTGQLVIHASTVQQSGSYFCCVRNGYGVCNPSEKSNLTILGKPISAHM